MNKPVPSYLIAFAVGQLETRKLSDRSRVRAVSSAIDAAAWEFANVERMIDVAERLFGEYPWGRFDILVMPRSFPYAGMENPCCTFVTPLLIVGDRSLEDVIAHELAHSWTGNLVTNAHWGCFWLNEGLTTWAQFRIIEALNGHDAAMLQAALLMGELHEDLKRFADQLPFTYLEVPQSSDVDPDEAFSRVPYMKGYLFVRLIEETVGRETFDAFIRNYIERFAFESITTQQFLDFVELVFPGVLDSIMASTWIEEPGHTVQQSGDHHRPHPRNPGRHPGRTPGDRRRADPLGQQRTAFIPPGAALHRLEPPGLPERAVRAEPQRRAANRLALEGARRWRQAKSGSARAVPDVGRAAQAPPAALQSTARQRQLHE